jgi:hypothetical protein
LGAGRFAAAARFMPVSGNLLHHAVEMFLAKLIGAAKIPRHHNLKKLWKLYRQHHHADSSLEKYTPVIAASHACDARQSVHIA